MAISKTLNRRNTRKMLQNDSHGIIFSHISGGLDMVYDIKINCSSPYIYLNFSVKDFPALDAESFHLKQSLCIPHKRTTTHVFLKTALDACGTTKKHQNDTVTYYNSIIAKLNSIQQTDIIEFPFSCTFGKERTIGIPSFQTRQRIMIHQGMLQTEVRHPFCFLIHCIRLNVKRQMYGWQP